MKFLLPVLAVLIISSCKKPEEYPIEPVITFKSISTSRNAQGFDQKMYVVLNFTDGDGDIGYLTSGLNDPIFDDPNSPYYNNYVADIFRMENGNWVPYPTILPLAGRLPYITPEGKNKAVKGEIVCEFAVPLQAHQDTFRLDVFIYDRGLHKSNTVSTDPFILNTQ